MLKYPSIYVIGSTPYNTLLEYGYCQDKPWLDIVTPKQQPTAVAWYTAAPRGLWVANIFNSAVDNCLLECSSIISNAPVRIFGFSYIYYFLTLSNDEWPETVQGKHCKKNQLILCATHKRQAQ